MQWQCWVRTNSTDTFESPHPELPPASPRHTVPAGRPWDLKPEWRSARTQLRPPRGRCVTPGCLSVASSTLPPLLLARHWSLVTGHCSFDLRSEICDLRSGPSDSGHRTSDSVSCHSPLFPELPHNLCNSGQEVRPIVVAYRAIGALFL